jgi:uncharacterized protein
VNVLRASVPCNGCRACCHGDLIVLHPENGDDPSAYETEPFSHPLTGKPCLALKHKHNGECVYLGPEGCTIHDRAPVICREFDCRRMYLSVPRAERRRLISAGVLDKEVLEAGRKRVHTLEPEAA